MSASFTRPVPQILGGAALAAPDTTRPVAALYFPSAGGVQAIDVTGAVFNLASSSGSIIPVADNVDDLGSAALRWHDVYFGGTVYGPAITAASSGNVTLTLSPAGTGNTTLAGPTRISPPVATSGTQSALIVTGAINTAMTAATEVPDVKFDIGRAVQWTAGAAFTQRAVLINRPIYTATAAQTIDDAATVAITNAPQASTNVTITRTMALWVQNGIARFDGTASVGGAPAASAALTVTSSTGGLLFPRMTEVERDAIAAPAAGLVVYNTTTNKLNMRAAAAWEVITSA